MCVNVQYKKKYISVFFRQTDDKPRDVSPTEQQTGTKSVTV